MSNMHIGLTLDHCRIILRLQKSVLSEFVKAEDKW